MTYLFLYIVGIILIWWIYRVGWLEALKTVVKVIVCLLYTSDAADDL